MTDTIKASAYLVVKATRSRFGPPSAVTGLRPIDTAKISQARQSRSPYLERDEILIKVTVQLPASAFDPIAPQALIVVPEGLVLDRHEIEVTADEDSEAPK